HAFLCSQRGPLVGHHNPRISAVLSLPEEPCTLHAHPAVVTGLITLAVALVHRSTGADPSLVAEPTQDGWLRLVVSDAPVSGDVLAVQAPVIIPPVVSCAKAAA